VDITSPAPPCPECGGARFWYGTVEFWVGGTSRSDDDCLNAAVCGNCGYSSLYLANMSGLREALARGSGQLPGPPDRSELRAFAKALRKQKKSGGA
jgi:predicted nucleic-acid-binding Zn-ribbon protein